MSDETVVIKNKPETSGNARRADSGARTAAARPSLLKAASSPKAQSSSSQASRAASAEYIGKYRIMGLVAKGGMGAVYKAVHPTLKRLVILKKLTIRNNPTVRERFKREAQILLDMQSPYIVHLYDYFIEGSSHYIVEEFVDGLSLSQMLEKQGPLGTEVALLVFLDACYALKFAHDRGIVHRDIKPGNILISRRAEVKLADFGIAASDKIEEIAVTKSDKIVTKTAGDVTMSGVTLGTPAYMSPEQITDSRSVDQRADIYSMGVMLYEMLTGTKPFPGKISEENLKLINRGKYKNPRKYDKSIPPVISGMIRKMLKGDPEKRFQSIDSVIKIVKKYLSEFDTHQIRICLAQIIAAKKDFKIPKFEKKSHVASKVFAGILSSAALVVLCVYGWRQGFFHETVLSHWFRPVTLNLITPVAGIENNIYGMDVPVKAYFFDEDDKNLPEVKGSRRDFKTSQGIVSRGRDGTVTTQLNRKNIKYLSIKPAYLRDGNYRVKILVGSYLVWDSFSVKGEAVNINFDELQGVSRKVSVKGNAYDSESGKNITKLAKFSVIKNGKYVPLSDVPESEFGSGKVIKLLVEAEGYRSQEFSMIVDWYQDFVYVDARMEKLK